MQGMHAVTLPGVLSLDIVFQGQAMERNITSPVTLSPPYPLRVFECYFIYVNLKVPLQSSVQYLCLNDGRR